MTILVRPEQAADKPAIHEVHRACFPTDAEARLVDRLRESGRLLVSLVAEVEGEVAGYIAFSPVEVEGAAGLAVGAGLAPVAVRPDRQRQGIGALLVRSGLAACAELAVGFVVVLGDPEYYQRFGFEPASRRGLDNEYGAGDAFLVMELQAGTLRPGLARYAPEFAALTGS
jgi:putative acetyltransferase